MIFNIHSIIFNELQFFGTEGIIHHIAIIVRSTLDYGSTIWDFYLQKDISSIEKIQKQAAGFISRTIHQEKLVQRLQCWMV